jgi:hypothetical protein
MIFTLPEARVILAIADEIDRSGMAEDGLLGDDQQQAAWAMIVRSARRKIDNYENNRRQASP